MPSGSAMVVEEALMVKEGERKTEKEMLLRGKLWLQRWEKEEEGMGMALVDRLDDLNAEEKKLSSLKELQQEAMDICYFKSSLFFFFKDGWISGGKMGFLIFWVWVFIYILSGAEESKGEERK